MSEMTNVEATNEVNELIKDETAATGNAETIPVAKKERIKHDFKCITKVKCTKCGNEKTFNTYSWIRNIKIYGSQQNVVDTYVCLNCREKKVKVSKKRETQAEMEARIRSEIQAEMGQSQVNAA